MVRLRLASLFVLIVPLTLQPAAVALLAKPATPVQRAPVPSPAPGAVEDVAEQAKRIVVMIDGKFGDDATSGAGIIFDRRADSLYIVTANHVVRRGNDEAKDLSVQVRSLPGERLPARLLAPLETSLSLDLAVVKVEGIGRYASDLAAIRLDRLGDANAIKTGDQVYAVGNPLSGRRWEVGSGNDHVTDANDPFFLVFQSASVAPGSSGGALFNAQHLVIGLVQKDTASNSQAIRIEHVLKTLKANNYQSALLAPMVGSNPSNAAPTPPKLGLPPPRLLSPPNGAHVDVDRRGVELQWEPVQSAAGYHVEIQTPKKDSAPGTDAWDDALVRPNPPVQGECCRRIYPLTLSPGQVIRWRVSTYGPDRTTGQPSDWAQFRAVASRPTLPDLDVPRLISPTDGALLDPQQKTFYLRWQPVPGANGYYVQLQTLNRGATPGAAFWEDIHPPSRMNPRDCCEQQVAYQLASGQPMRWRVFAIRQDGSRGPASDWRAFSGASSRRGRFE